MMKFSVARFRLAVLWWGVSGLILALFALFTLTGDFCDDGVAIMCSHTESVWAWYLASLGPSLSLITAAVAADANQTGQTRSTRKPYFYFAAGLSLIYLATTLLTAIFIVSNGRSADQTIEFHSRLLGPLLQMMTAGSLGLFFVRTESEPD